MFVKDEKWKEGTIWRENWREDKKNGGLVGEKIRKERKMKRKKVVGSTLKIFSPNWRENIEEKML